MTLSLAPSIGFRQQQTLTSTAHIPATTGPLMIAATMGRSGATGWAEPSQLGPDLSEDLGDGVEAGLGGRRGELRRRDPVEVLEVLGRAWGVVITEIERPRTAP